MKDRELRLLQRKGLTDRALRELEAGMRALQEQSGLEREFGEQLVEERGGEAVIHVVCSGEPRGVSSDVDLSCVCVWSYALCCCNPAIQLLEVIGSRCHFGTLSIHVAPSLCARLQTVVSLGPPEGATTHHSIKKDTECTVPATGDIDSEIRIYT